jgi:hypothetical protein
MAEGWGPTAANHALTTEAALYTWCKLHVGAPGSAGTANAAAETTRKQVTWGTASGGVISNTNDLVWTAVAGTEDFTHFSMWTASTAGTFGWSGVITANAVTIGDTFTIPIGDHDNAVTLAS